MPIDQLSPSKAAPTVWGTTTTLDSTVASSGDYCLLLDITSSCWYHPLPRVAIQMPLLKMPIQQKYNTKWRSVLWNLLGAKKFPRASWKWYSDGYLPLICQTVFKFNSKFHVGSNMLHYQFKCKLPHLLFQKQKSNIINSNIGKYPWFFFFHLQDKCKEAMIRVKINRFLCVLFESIKE